MSRLFARQLKLENLRSLHARYGDPIPEDLEDEHTWDISDIASYIESPGFIKHEVTCLDYQSCEHGGWRDPNNKVAQVVNQLWELVKDADEDPKAPWGIGWEVGKLSTWDHENEGVG